jgi:preprotein translocase subunit YajC
MKISEIIIIALLIIYFFGKVLLAFILSRKDRKLMKEIEKYDCPYKYF